MVPAIFLVNDLILSYFNLLARSAASSKLSLLSVDSVCLSVGLQLLMLNISDTKRLWGSCAIWIL